MKHIESPIPGIHALVPLNFALMSHNHKSISFHYLIKDNPPSLSSHTQWPCVMWKFSILHSSII